MRDHLAAAVRGGGVALVLGAMTFGACALDREGVKPAGSASATASATGSGGAGTTTSASGPGTGGATGGSSSVGGDGGGGTGTAGAGGVGGSAVCGDGMVTSPEECDDSNAIPYDGCSASCVDEKPEACPGTAVALDSAGVTITNDLTGKTNDFSSDCGGQAAGDLVYAVTVADAGILNATLSGGFSKILFMRSDCETSRNALCDTGGGNADATMTVLVDANETVYVFVDGYQGAVGPFTLTLDLVVCGDGVLEPPEECDDGNVADGDGCSNACAVTCGPGETKYSGTHHCYTWEQSSASWSTAQTNCKAKGPLWDLASVTSSGERDFIDNTLNTDQNVWLGGTDQDIEGTFVWTDGEPFSYQSFIGIEPNGGMAENCIEQVTSTGSDYWADLSCSSSRDYICERKAAGE